MNATLECGHEVACTAACILRSGDDGTDRRQGILDAMVEFAQQDLEPFLSALAFRDVDIDANHALRAPFRIVGHEAA
jgi:hypothetical protein